MSSANIVAEIRFKLLNEGVLSTGEPCTREYVHMYMYVYCIMYIIYTYVKIIYRIYQAFSGDFQRACGKMHAQILLGMRWCAMSIFLFLKFYHFNKGIMRICSIFKKPKTNVFILHLLTLNIYNLQQNDV